MEQDWKPVTTSHITDLITMQSGKEASQDEVQAAIDDQTSPRTVEVSSRGDFRLNGLSVHIWSAEQIRGEPAFSAVSYGTSKQELQLTNRLLSLCMRTARLDHTGLNGKIHGSDLDFTFPCPANVCRHSKDGEPILSRSVVPLEPHILHGLQRPADPPAVALPSSPATQRAPLGRSRGAEYRRPRPERCCCASA